MYQSQITVFDRLDFYCLVFVLGLKFFSLTFFYFSHFGSKVGFLFLLKKNFFWCCHFYLMVMGMKKVDPVPSEIKTCPPQTLTKSQTLKVLISC